MLRRLFNRLLGKPAWGPIPVLCYHSWTVNGSDYASNDHEALKQDLQTLARKGYEVLPVEALVALLRGELDVGVVAGRKLVCLTFDDGRDHDYLPADYGDKGSIPGFHALLKESMEWLPQRVDGYRAVSFVIASPQARAIMDQNAARGRDEWRDCWWEECARKGIIGIANHSWDHVHDTLPEVRQRENRKADFHAVDNPEDAERQIAAAQDYINQVTDGRTVPVFCYPYGHVSEYVRDHYLPSHGGRLGLRAAFSTAGASVTEASNIWALPRFVCGWHWRSPEEFSTLLKDVARSRR